MIKEVLEWSLLVFLPVGRSKSDKWNVLQVVISFTNPIAKIEEVGITNDQGLLVIDHTIAFTVDSSKQ